MHLYKTKKGNIIVDHEDIIIINDSWDMIINRNDLFKYLSSLIKNNKKISKEEFEEIITKDLQAPMESQEVWAAGVTYIRSRDARMEESKTSGGSDFYQKVYEAERPELFFKSLPHRVAAHNEQVFIRKDSAWNVPEPELTLFINSFGEIQAYTIGNDMSSRSIEGENPLYLPQAKTYERSAALGPCLYVAETPISSDTKISLQISRDGQEKFSGSIQLNRMKRSFTELAGFLFRECKFNTGCFLMTGTGIVPPDNFTLQKDDEIKISVDGIGILVNKVSFQ